ncbi:hypothetical protein PT250_07185 [Erysipelothrix rhusiopathiae]|uniref:hypothetical protein n=1 Tax=Erysipelothrix rhusiopathiae TaxID=1648 RepID=UPI000F459B2D|nr:hypothetical protein [Erysipelothrix rhusiopathiae]MDE8257149.1 hypothetical protein [Erysipelothrix rhusiopathiae]MDE8339664.1 hypothetical protein [Erysipelothrix rhusiopathiae]MDE8341878.1 hypothetical protein [Erysipelothrix rhusiopathiae]MDV7680275.1 hypothetical protein [Erysipelothrix rhusiopathiae]RNM32083.1 hypothetical protein EF876_00200 [Erysipelothrix rhusiopathiae]
MNFVDFCDAVSVIKGYVLYDPLQNLREQAYNPDSVTKLIRDGERIFVADLNVLERYTLNHNLAYLYRLNHLYKDALYYTEKCIDYAHGTTDHEIQINNLIDKAIVLKCLKYYEIAIELFDSLEANEFLNDVSGALDRIYHERAKCLLEMNEFTQAKHYFNKALDIRLQSNNSELIDETEEALDYAQSIEFKLINGHEFPIYMDDMVLVDAYYVPSSTVESYIKDREFFAMKAQDVFSSFCSQVERKWENTEEGEAIVGYDENNNIAALVYLNPKGIENMLYAYQNHDLESYLLRLNQLSKAIQ